VTTPSGLGYAEFADRLGTDFALRLPGGDRVPLVLIECTAAAQGSFSLIFKAGPGAPAEQAIYELAAEGFGPEAIFLVPVGRRPHDAQFPLEYQAIFSSVPAPDASA